MAEEKGLGKRSEDLTPDDSSQVIRLPVESDRGENRLELRRDLRPENSSVEGKLPGSELPGDGDLGPDAEAEDLGVGWDTPEGESKSVIPMGWLALIVIFLILLGGWGVIR